jgi:hypothetical protein
MQIAIKLIAWDVHAKRREGFLCQRLRKVITYEIL